MDHPPPHAFPNPARPTGTAIPPPLTKPNPAYQELLTLYARVYGAHDQLAGALHPACRTMRDRSAWTGDAARRWVTELEHWNRRLAGAADEILHELAARLRATPPYVPNTTIDSGGPEALAIDRRGAASLS